MPSFKDTAIKEIKKHPEIFSALEEFEKTKRIPKFTYRKRVDITIDEQILREFKFYCQKKGFNMSRLIEKHIKEDLNLQ